MNIEDLKNRKRPVYYGARKHSGRATVTRIYEGETGAWVELFDRDRDRVVTVRPGQVHATKPVPPSLGARKRAE